MHAKRSVRRSAFHLRVRIANETRGEEERKELTEYLHNQLDKLEREADRVAQQLKKDVKDRCARRQVVISLSPLELSIFIPNTKQF